MKGFEVLRLDGGCPGRVPSEDSLTEPALLGSPHTDSAGLLLSSRLSTQELETEYGRDGPVQ